MPHFIIEYSRNLEQDIAIPELMRVVHDCALASDMFDLWAVRTRAEPRDDYIIADGNPDHGFVQLTVRVRPGRDENKRMDLARTVHEKVVAFLAPSFAKRQLAVNVEVQEVTGASVRHKTLGQS